MKKVYKIMGEDCDFWGVTADADKVRRLNLECNQGEGWVWYRAIEYEVPEDTKIVYTVHSKGGSVIDKIFYDKKDLKEYEENDWYFSPRSHRIY